jgi:hypothetical protein
MPPPNEKSQVEEFLAELNGTVEALVFAYGGLVATHPEPAKPLALLNSLLEAATKSSTSSPSTQFAHKKGMVAAFSKLAEAAKFAHDVQAMNRGGPKQ